MTGSAIAMMITICALVWGGFATCMTFVWKIEKRKTAQKAAQDPEKQNHE